MNAVPYPRCAGAAALLASALLLGTASPAHAAASFASSVDATLALFEAIADVPLDADPFDLDVLISSDKDSAEFSVGDAAAFGEADALSGVFGTFFSSSLEFNLLASAGGSAAADPDPSEAFSDGFAAFEIEIFNGNPFTGYTILGDVSFFIEAEAAVDAPAVEGAYASADVVLEALAGGDLLGGTTPFAGAEAGFGGGLFDADSMFEIGLPIELFIGPDSSEILYFEVYADGLADSAAVVPVPAALPLLISALAGLITVRRRG